MFRADRKLRGRLRLPSGVIDFSGFDHTTILDGGMMLQLEWTTPPSADSLVLARLIFS